MDLRVRLLGKGLLLGGPKARQRVREREVASGRARAAAMKRPILLSLDRVNKYRRREEMYRVLAGSGVGLS